MKPLKRTFAFLYLLLATSTCYSQLPGNNVNLSAEPAWNWTKKISGSGGPHSKDLVPDGNGQYYLTGYFSGTMTYNGHTLNSAGNNDTYIVKLNASGDVIWIKQISATPEHYIRSARLVVLANGDFLVNGNLSGTVQFGSNTLNAAPGDVFLARFDADGNNLWASRYSEWLPLNVKALAADANGTSYTITSDGSIGSNLLIYEPSGQFNNNWHYSTILIEDIALRNSNLYFCGKLNAASNFGTFILSSGRYPSAFFGKSDLSGNLIWADNGKSTNGTSDAGSLTLDNNGNIFVAGAFNDTIRFNLASARLYSDFYPYFVVKYNNSGTCLWSSQYAEYNYGLGNAEQVFADTNGNPLVTGYHEMEMSFGSSTLTTIGNFIASFSSTGNKNWAKNIPYSPSRTFMVSMGEIMQAADFPYNIAVCFYNQNASLVWSKESTSDGGYADIIYRMDLDKTGKIYIQGRCKGTVYFDGIQSSDNGAYLSKLKGDGSVIWRKSFTLPLQQYVSPSGVKTDKEGNCYAWGTFSDSLTIEGNFLRTPHNGGEAAYLVKYDKNGNYQWLNTFYANHSLIGYGGITTDNSGQVSITGSFTDTLSIGGRVLAGKGSQDIFIAGFSPDGGLVFAENFGGTNVDYGRGISTDALNNIYLTGGFRNSVSFGNTILTSLGSYDIFIAKFDSHGNPLWAKQAGSTANDKGHAIVTDSIGNSYIAGITFAYSASFGGITITSPFTNNLFLAKYSPDGNPLWARSIGSDSYAWPSYQLGLDEEGSCYMGGMYLDTLFLEGGGKIKGNYNEDNSFIVKYNANGSFQWDKNLVPIANANGGSDLISLVAFNKNSLLAGGWLYYTTLPLGNDSLTCYDNQGVFIALLGDNLPFGVNDFTTVPCHFRVYPNPSSGIVNLKFDEPAGQPVTCSISDVRGRTVFSGKSAQSGTMEIHLPDLQAGVYIISIDDGKCISREKLILR